MLYYYRSKIGLFRIYPRQGRYALEINGTIYGTYHSAVAAADDVYTHCTGCYEWDNLDGRVNAPSDLSEWNVTPL